MITLRDYQEDLLTAIKSKLAIKSPPPRGPSVLAVAPTGAGKTVIFSGMVARCQGKGMRALILVHRKELLDQISRTLTMFKVEHGIISPGRAYDPFLMIHVGMVNTVGNRLARMTPPSLIVIDECHHAVSKTYAKVLGHFSGAFVVGVTATPERRDKRGLGEVFQHIVLGPSVRWLFDNNFLCKPKYFMPPMVADISKVRMEQGDYAAKELAKAMDHKVITGDAIGHYRKICPGEPAIAFCVSIKHAEHVAEEFNAAGIPASVIHSKQTSQERAEAVKALGERRIHVLASVDVVSEGFDVPIVTAAILLRPTTSLSLHLQQIGRVLRNADGKEFSIIIDHVNNLLKHGFAEDNRYWSLDGVKKKDREEDDELPDVKMVQCEKCFCMHPKAPACPECGFEYPEPEGRHVATVAGQLEEFAPEITDHIDYSLPLPLLLANASSVADLQAIQKAKGYKQGWVWHQKQLRGL